MNPASPTIAAADRDARPSRPMRPIRTSLAQSGGLLAAFLAYTALAVWWGPFQRLDATLDRNFHVQSYWPLLHIVDRIGQRAVCLPILGIIVILTVWRHRSWRPANLAVFAVVLVNLCVLIVKLALSRGRPLMYESFFSDGDMYPSGHTANIMVVYGIGCYLISHYWEVGPRVRRAMVCVVGVLCVIMFTTSLLLRWHWFSDLVGGLLIGGSVLMLAIGIDTAIPFVSARLVMTQQPERQPGPLLAGWLGNSRIRS